MSPWVVRTLATSAITWSTAAVTQVISPPEILDLYRTSVVRIESLSTLYDETTERSTGTGFVVSRDGYVATALHVIGHPEDYATQTIIGRIGSVGAQRDAPPPFESELSVVEIDDVNDVALLRFASPPPNSEPLPLRIDRPITQGEPITYLTYTFGTSLYVDDGLIKGAPEVRQLWVVNKSFNVSDSGGPIFDANGEAIGMVYGGVERVRIGTQESRVSDTGWMTPLSPPLISVLEKNRVDLRVGCSDICTHGADRRLLEQRVELRPDKGWLGFRWKDNEERFAVNAPPGFVVSKLDFDGARIDATVTHAVDPSGTSAVVEAKVEGNKEATISGNLLTSIVRFTELPESINRQYKVDVHKVDRQRVRGGKYVYSELLTAEPGYRITSAQIVERKSAFALQPQAEVEPDGSAVNFRVTFLANLHLGPFRIGGSPGWFSGTVVTEQVKISDGS